MICAEFAAEQYELYALGLLEADRAVVLSTHLADECQTCGQGVRRSLTFWAMFGATVVGAPPASQLEVAVPASSTSLASTNLRSFPSPLPRLTQRRWLIGAAAAALVAVSLSTGIWVGTKQGQTQGLGRSSTGSTATDFKGLESRIRQLSSERDRALEDRRQAEVRLQDANRAVARVTAELNGTRVTLSQLKRAPSTPPLDSDSAQQLAQLQAQLASAQATIAQNQSQQIRQQQQLAAAERSPRPAEEQLRAQLQTLAAQSAAVTNERDRLTQALLSAQQAETQNARVLVALAETGSRFVAVRGTEAAPNARGYAVLTQQGRSLFYAAGLPNLPAGRQYQLWLIRARTPAVVSGGVFHASVTATARLDFTNPSSTVEVVGVAVTEEPTGGSAQPTGHKLLAGTAHL